MKLTLALGLTLIAGPALAHADGTLHTHDSVAVFWGLGLIAAAAVSGLMTRKAVTAKR